MATVFSLGSRTITPKSHAVTQNLQPIHFSLLTIMWPSRSDFERAFLGHEATQAGFSHNLQLKEMSISGFM
jgi:hypothetical protein